MENNGNLVKVIEECKISPSSPNSLPSKFSLPLAAFDWIFIRFPPLQRLFFYPLPNNSDSLFQSIIIPNLKLSLSLTLQHFFPLAGALVWPDDAPFPFILYSQNDVVSFTLAESLSDDDFHTLSSPHPLEIHRSRSLFPPFHSHSHSHSPIPMCAIQVTKFPNRGFSIGFSIHHVIADGQSFNLFLKSWAYICKKLNQLECSPHLPCELIPSFDRSGENMIGNPFDFVPNDRNLSHYLSFLVPSDWHRATFDLTPNHIQKLKKSALEYWTRKEKKEELHLSTFVVGYAHALVCLAKAKGDECLDKFYVTLAADARSRITPPISTNYFGNCVVHPGVLLETRELREEENGFSIVAKKLGDLILELRTWVIDVEKIPKDIFVPQVELCSIGDSPKYKFYKTDFGWGEPKQVEMASLGCNNILFIDARDGGGVELGLILPSHHMDVFASLFVQGID